MPLSCASTASFLAFVSFCFSVICLFSPFWVRNHNTGYHGGLLWFCTSWDCYWYADDDYDYPSSEFRTGSGLWIVAMFGSLFVVVSGCVACCLSCCARLPAKMVAAACTVACFVVFIFNWTTVMLVAASYGNLYDTKNQKVCGNDSGYFRIGNCNVGWSMWLAVANIILTALTTLLFIPNLKSTPEPHQQIIVVQAPAPTPAPAPKKETEVAPPPMGTATAAAAGGAVSPNVGYQMTPVNQPPARPPMSPQVAGYHQAAPPPNYPATQPQRGYYPPAAPALVYPEQQAYPPSLPQNYASAPPTASPAYGNPQFEKGAHPPTIQQEYTSPAPPSYQDAPGPSGGYDPTADNQNATPNIYPKM